MAHFYEARLRDDPRLQATFTVDDLADGRAIGMADYRDLDPFAGRATVGITIGERDRWGGGYGSEALRLLLGHLFGPLRLRRIELDTWSGNERALRTFRAAGFVEEGRRRSSVRVGDEWHDTVLFGLLNEEWTPDH
ncbi:GNAT family N-acetyltransferase [Streptomyces sp. NPDC001530]|uniref:GNAT family N-acetyltransferase n=1 Tax=Streptomyces sp. NPDC001530 TaxID=3364582 RepID=UPI0036ADA9A6